MQKYNSRAEVPDKYKSDLTDFYKDEKDFNKCFKETEKLIDKLPKYKGCTKDSEKLLEFLELDNKADILANNLYVYSYIINDQELGVTKSIERLAKSEKLFNKLCVNSSFFDVELLNLSNEDYYKLFDNKKLKKYKSLLDQIYRFKAHILTENEEKIVISLTNAMDHYSDMSSDLLNSEHDYGKIKLDDGTTETISSTNYGKLLKNKNINIRKKVYKSFNKVLDRYSLTNSKLLDSYVNEYNTIAKIRKFKSSWDEHLFNLNMDNEVFKTLVKTTENNLDSLHKYFKLKKEVLNLDVMNKYDLNLEMSNYDKEYTIEEAIDLIREALKPLGEEYIEKYNKVINNHYIDFCQYKGKCSGGYSISTADHNSRIILSFNGNLVSISIIAHEVGHNIKHQYVMQNNESFYTNTSSITGEVASLTNECLLSDYLSKNGKTKEEKLAGLSNIIGVIASNLFGAVREGKIEQEMYDHALKGNSITKEFMDKKTKSSLKKYYGDAVKLDKYSKNDWITRSHYYMNFYLYSYAISMCAALLVSSKIINGDEDMLNKYIEFLETGSDKNIMETYEILGIDLKEPKLYEDAIKYFDSLLDRYYKIYNEVE